MILFVSWCCCDPAAQNDVFQKLLGPDWPCGGLIHLNISASEASPLYVSVALGLSIGFTGTSSIAFSVDLSLLNSLILIKLDYLKLYLHFQCSRWGTNTPQWWHQGPPFPAPRALRSSSVSGFAREFMAVSQWVGYETVT